MIFAVEYPPYVHYLRHICFEARKIAPDSALVEANDVVLVIGHESDFDFRLAVKKVPNSKLCAKDLFLVKEPLLPCKSSNMLPFKPVSKVPGHL